MKRILFISPTLGGGGAERQMVTVACALKENGYDVEFLCYLQGNFYENILKDCEIKIHWFFLPNYFQRMIKIRKFLRKETYDVVISFTETPSFLNNYSSLGKKKWKVITGERSAKEVFFQTYKGKIFSWFQRFADYIVCNSENSRQMWIKHHPEYEFKLKLIYNTVKISPIKTTYNIRRDGRLHIIVAASYQSLKNPIGLIEALNLLTAEERSKIHVDWYGRIKHLKKETIVFEDCQQLIKKYSLNEIIYLHEATNDIHNKMYEADVVGLFSSVEGLPNTICEGMVLGKPIIMSKVSDYSILVDDSNGYLCDWNDSSSIKESILNMEKLSKEELLKKGQMSKQKADVLFSKEKIINNWIDIIDN